MKATDIVSSYRQFCSSMENYRSQLYFIQLVISFYAVGIAIWHGVQLVKKYYLKDLPLSLNPWVKIFFNPIDSNMLNYLILCLLMFIMSAAIYFALNNNIVSRFVRNVRNDVHKVSIRLQLTFIGISIIVITHRSILVKAGALIGAVAVASLSLILTYIIVRSCKSEVLASKVVTVGTVATGAISKVINSFALFAVLALLLAVSMEPINVIKGPVYLFNEYDISSETLLNGDRIDNEKYLERLPQHIDMTAISNTYPAVSLGLRKDLDILSMISSNKLPQVSNYYEVPGRSYNDFDKLSDFMTLNVYQWDHYNISRGQMNHLGTILNPIGAIELGKKPSSCYLQYGVGNTFLLKWIMDLAGGVSIQNFYKCYIVYIVYALSFLAMLFIIFRNTICALPCFAVFAYTFFYQGYTAFVIAPGILPSIRIMDVIAVIFFVAYVRCERIRYLFLAQLAALLAVIINRQFGLFLLSSLVVATILYNVETRQKSVWKWCLSFFAAISSVFAIYLISFGRTDSVMKYFFLGYFSWSAPTPYILGGILFVALSYFYLFMLKDTKHYMKYVYVMIFAYVQGLGCYFYWSGLLNHLPAVLPFMGLQVMLMLFMVQQRIVNVDEKVTRYIPLIIATVSLLLLVVILPTIKAFYAQKALFLGNFICHTKYNWNYDRAKVITTINNKPFDESISLIEKYSPESTGIYILSRYDNLLPFISKHYSQMPYFEMAWHMISNKHVVDTSNFLKKTKPAILYVDTDILIYKKDNWNKLYENPYTRKELESRMGRKAEMRKIFLAVQDRYELIDKGALLSVYKLTK